MPDVRIPEWEERRPPRQCNSQKGKFIADSSQGSCRIQRSGTPAAPGRWRMSARVRTRKMVNYAWAERSQRKLWWRSVVVLMCKSVVRPGYGVKD